MSRFADIWVCYKQWTDKGALFLTEPLKNPDGWEWRCYMRDPDGYLIEVGQYTQMALERFKELRRINKELSMGSIKRNVKKTILPRPESRCFLEIQPTVIRLP
jgi:hypothetical protein